MSGAGSRSKGQYLEAGISGCARVRTRGAGERVGDGACPLPEPCIPNSAEVFCDMQETANIKTSMAVPSSQARNVVDAVPDDVEICTNAQVEKVEGTHHGDDPVDRIPESQTRLQSLGELLTGRWLHAHLKYDDFPGDRDSDVEAFNKGQTNFGLVSALMLTINVSYMIEIAEREMLGPHGTIAGLIFGLAIVVSTGLFFTSVGLSVFHMMAVGQADAPAEAYYYLQLMKRYTDLTCRAFVFGMLTLGLAVLVYFYIINEMPDLPHTCDDPESDDCIAFPAQVIVFWGTVGLVSIGGLMMVFAATEIISKMYHAKRHFKLTMRAALSEEDEQWTLERTQSMKVVDMGNQLGLQVYLSTEEILNELLEFERKLSSISKALGKPGFAFLDLDKFERYLFRKHKPKGVKEDQEVFCIFAPVTRKRVQAVFDSYVDERVKAEAKEIVEQHLKQRIVPEATASPAPVPTGSPRRKWY